MEKGINIFNGKLQAHICSSSTAPNVSHKSSDASVFWRRRPTSAGVTPATMSLLGLLLPLREQGLISNVTAKVMLGDVAYFTYASLFEGEMVCVTGHIDKKTTSVGFEKSGGLHVPSEKDIQIAQLVAYETYASFLIDDEDKEAFEKMEAITANDMYLHSDVCYYALKAAGVTTTVDHMVEVVTDVASDKTMLSKGALTSSYDVFGDDISASKIDSDGLADEWEEIKSGKYRLEKDWGEMTVHVPPLAYLEKYVPTPHYYQFIKTLAYRLEKAKECEAEGRNIDFASAVHMLLSGEPGSGKTTVFFALAATFGLPIVVIPQSKNMDESLYMGDYSVREGNVAFTESYLIKAAKHGGIVVFEEANMTPPGVTTYLNDFLDFPYQLRDRENNVISRNPFCILGATMNPETSGSNKMNAAFVSRFKECAVLETPTKELLQQIVGKMHPTLTANIVSWTIDLREAIIKFLRSDAVCEPRIADGVSLRQVDAVLRSIEEGNTPDEAKDRMFTTVFIASPELAADVRKTVDSFRSAPSAVFVKKPKVITSVSKTKKVSEKPVVSTCVDELEILSLDL